VKAEVVIRLADAAPDFTKAALDLLEAVQDSDQALVSDRIVQAAERFQRLIDRERGNW